MAKYGTTHPACHWCGREDEYATVDHMLPRYRRPEGGTGPVVPACEFCNSRRGHDDWVPFWVWSEVPSLGLPKSQLRCFVLLGIRESQPGATLEEIIALIKKRAARTAKLKRNRQAAKVREAVAA